MYLFIYFTCSYCNSCATKWELWSLRIIIEAFYTQTRINSKTLSHFVSSPYLYYKLSTTHYFLILNSQTLRKRLFLILLSLELLIQVSASQAPILLLMQLLFNLNLCFYHSPSIYNSVINNYTMYIEPVLLEIFTSSLEEKTKCTLNEFEKTPNLGDAVSMPEGRTTIQGNVDYLENWTNRNLIKFNHNKCKTLRLE